MLLRRSWWSGYSVPRLAVVRLGLAAVGPGLTTIPGLVATGSGLADAGFDAGLDQKVQPFSEKGIVMGRWRRCEGRWGREKKGARWRRAEEADGDGEPK
jgi:hypothetical protein